MKYLVSVLTLLFIAGCGDTQLGDSVEIGGSVAVPLTPTDAPTVLSTTPTTLDLSPLPSVVGVTKAEAAVSIYSDSSCNQLVGAGVADTNGAFSIPINNPLEGGTEATFWARAQADGFLVSECSSTSVTYRTTAIRPGLAVFSGTQTTAPSAPTQVNQATAYGIQWSQSEFDSSYYSHSTSTDSETITIEQNGNYWVSATLPLEMMAGTYRPCVRMEIRVNGVLVSGGIGQSTYIRYDPATGNYESSGHVAMLLSNLSATDEIEVFLQESAGHDGSEVVSITSVASLYLEKVEDTRTLFTATANRTVASTNINGGASPFEWTEDRKDSGFIHDDGVNPENITLAAGTYLAFLNIPINGTATRASPRIRVRLNGAVVNGGQASQGYMRNDSGHNDSSLHWSGYFTASNGDILTVTSEAEGGGGTVNVQAGQVATLAVENLASTDNFIALRATQLLAGVDWNQVGGSNIAWTTSDFADASVYNHSTLTNPDQIQINEPGDYFLTYNDSVTGSNDRVNPIISVLVNGTPVSGAESKTHYIRNTSGHNESSTSLTFLLRNLSAGDVVTLQSQLDVGAGAVTIVEDALLTLTKK